MCEAMRVITENIKAEGIQIGRFEIVAELYRDHTLSAEKAAAKLNMPVEQFLARTRMKMC